MESAGAGAMRCVPWGRVRMHPATFIETLRGTRRRWTRPAPAETTSFGPAHTLNAQVDGDGQVGRWKHSTGQPFPIPWWDGSLPPRRV